MTLDSADAINSLAVVLLALGGCVEAAPHASGKAVHRSACAETAPAPEKEEPTIQMDLEDGAASAPPRTRGEEGPSSAPGRRLGPPSALACSRDHLTSFNGRVLAYERRKGRIFLRMRTDEETTESFTLRFGKGEDPLRWLLIEGGPFRPGDWSRVEQSPGELRSAMRAIVWACDDGSRPVIDWRPGEDQAQPAPPR